MSVLRIARTLIYRCRGGCELAVSGGTPGRAVKIAAVVGTLLVLINQGDAVFGAASVDWIKAGLTYCVPYLVSTYTSVSKDLSIRRETGAME